MNFPKGICMVVACATCAASALEPGDVIVNEIYFQNRGGGKNHFEAVELLVVKDQADLNSLTVSDRDFWKYQGEDQCILQDLGQGFLGSVPSGTLIILYNGVGTDDIDPKDFVLRFYAKSSLYCNLAPTTNCFLLNDGGDNIHLLQEGRQIDFVKYRASNFPTQGAGNPGELHWEQEHDGVVDIGPRGESTGIRFIGDKPDLNDYHATWQPFTETYLTENFLGKPNGGRNSQWIDRLRKTAGSKGE